MSFLNLSKTLALLVLPICIFAQTSVQNVLIEQSAGAWNGWHPDGAVFLDNTIQAYPNTALPLNIHNGDAMANAQSDSIINFYTNAFPLATFNRVGPMISQTILILQPDTLILELEAQLLAMITAMFSDVPLAEFGATMSFQPLYPMEMSLPKRSLTLFQQGGTKAKST